MNRKIVVISAVVAVGVVVAALAAYLYLPAPAPEVVTIKFWEFPNTADDEALFAPLIQEFESKHPNVKIELSVLPWSGRFQKMIAAAGGGEAPDVAYLNPDFLGRYAELQIITPLDNFSTPQYWNDITAPKASYTYKGKIYGAPVLTFTSGWLYNVDMFKEAGIDRPPKNWDELVEVCEKLKAAGYYAVGYPFKHWSANHFCFPWLKDNGGWWFDEEKNVATINNEAGVKTLTQWHELYAKGYIPPGHLSLNWEEVTSEFFQGKVAMIRINDYQTMAAYVAGYKGVLEDETTFPYDTFPNFKYALGSIGTYAVFKQSKHPELAWAWVEFLTTGDANKKFLEAAGFSPARGSVHVTFKSKIVQKMVQENMPIMFAESTHWAFRPANAILVTIWPAAVSGDIGVKEALDQAASQINAILKAGP